MPWSIFLYVFKQECGAATGLWRKPWTILERCLF